MAEDPRFNFPEVGMALLTRGEKKGKPAHMQKWSGIENAKSLRDPFLCCYSSYIQI